MRAAGLDRPASYEDRDLSDLVASTLPQHHGHFWGGNWHSGSGEVVPSINPSTEQVLAEFQMGTASDVDEAVCAAQRASTDWAATPPLERGRLLRRAASIVRDHALELALLDAADCGNPVKAMQMDAEIAATQLDYFAGLVLENKGETIPTGNQSLNYTLREPLGVVGRIFPFNHPFMFAAGKMAAPLAAGNTVILKGSENCPRTHQLIVEAFQEAGFPAGVVNYITNAPADAGAVVEAMVSHPAVRRVNFTGSTRVGRLIAMTCAKYLKPAVLELGGKAPMVVLDDADPALAGCSVDTVMGAMLELPVSDETWTAKFSVMKENLEHHIEEEEGEMFKQARQVFDDAELLTFRKFGSRLQGHPIPNLPMVDVATGSPFAPSRKTGRRPTAPMPPCPSGSSSS